jgi:transcription elongation GreA/GreB family factor
MNTFSTSQKLHFKQQLKSVCIDILEKRISNAQQAMQHAQDAANSSDKSSAGDKYETARAMGQLNRDMNAKQLEEARREHNIIANINPDQLHTKITAGAVVVCKEHTFFIALGLGMVTVEDQKIVVLSPKAPLATLLNKKQAGDIFIFNGKEISIVSVF